MNCHADAAKSTQKPTTKTVLPNAVLGDWMGISILQMPTCII